MYYILIFFFITCSGCNLTKSHASTNLPFDSFVKVVMEVKFDVCVKTKTQSFCEKRSYMSSGSGFFVRKSKNTSYIMSAAHVCIPDINKHSQMPITNLETSFSIQTTDNKKYNAEVFKVPSEFIEKKKPIDLCLLKINKKLKHKIIKLSKTAPRMGQELYNLSAPGGFFFPPSVPIYSGYYSGKMSELHCLLSIPAKGGSSGSPVMDKGGNLVGVLFAANPKFHHISIMMSHGIVKNFLEKSFKLTSSQK
tara:strand:+ start:1576 stop:2325 length:750 start_codon:yes stop_codon:yes gene_type:complete